MRKGILFLLLVVCSCCSKQPLDVVSIQEEEFYSSLSEYEKYNQGLNTNISEMEKRTIEQTIVKGLSAREREWYESGDLVINNIGRFSQSGEYYADIWWANELQAIFLKGLTQTNGTRIIGSIESKYSIQNIYAGQVGFDCDEYVKICFYKNVRNHNKQLFAQYENKDYRLDISDNTFPALFWKDNSLYCRFVSRYDNTSREYYKIVLRFIRGQSSKYESSRDSVESSWRVLPL